MPSAVAGDVVGAGGRTHATHNTEQAQCHHNEPPRFMALCDSRARPGVVSRRRYRDSFRGESRYSTWLYLVTATSTLSFLRRRRRLSRETPVSATASEDGTPWLDRQRSPRDVRSQVIAAMF